TGFGAIVGTLESMSPGRGEVNQLDIETRSDVYSPGVLLYKFLTGPTPFPRRVMERGGGLGILRATRGKSPPSRAPKLATPEGRRGRGADGRAGGGAERAVGGRGEGWGGGGGGGEKPRPRRYETANGFALDVQRYLADEPVLACPPSVGYRLRKFVRRNKGPV